MSVPLYAIKQFLNLINIYSYYCYNLKYYITILIKWMEKVFLISGKKNITKSFLSLLTVLLILITLVGCSKTYTVRVYSSGINQYKLQQAEEDLYVAKLAKSEILITLAENKIQQIENSPDKVKTYKAKKIIDFTSISARFIDKEGKEQFVSGKKVEIQEISN